MRTHVGTAAVLVVAVLVALPGCGSAARDSVAGGSTSTGSSTPAPTGSTDVDCGQIDIQQGEAHPVRIGTRERSCLEQALRDHRSAKLTVTAPTIEGDPIVTTWRLLADGRLGAEIDGTADRHAGTGPPVNHVDCGVVTAIPDPLECAPQS